MVGRMKLLKEKLKEKREYINKGNDRCFSLIELVVAVGILLVIGVAVSFGYPGYVDWRNDSEVKLATQTAYESAINVIDNPWEEMTVDEVMDYVEGEYKNVELSYTGSTAADLCVTGNLKGDIEGKYTKNRGNCDGSLIHNPDPSDSETTEPPTEISTSTVSTFQCDATTTAKLPTYGMDSSATVVVTGDDGSTVEVSHTNGRTDSVTMNSGTVYKVVVDKPITLFSARDFTTYESNFTNCLISVDEWAEGLEKVSFAFSTKLSSLPNYLPSTVTSIERAFAFTPYNGSDVTTWNTSNITDMSNAFSYNSQFNQDISGWETGKVTTMGGMFYSSSAFNQNLSEWDVGNVKTMFNMFNNSSFNNGSSAGVSDIPLSWDVGTVENMSGMFYGTPFNQFIGDWETNSLTNTHQMFASATSFNQPLNDWNMSNVTNMEGMFMHARTFNQPLNNWDTGTAINLNRMFYSAYAFSQDLSMWNIDSVNSATQFNLNSGLTPEQLPDF